MDVSLFPIRVLPGVLVTLFPVSGKAGTWRHPHPDDSTVSWAAWVEGRAKDLDSRKSHPNLVALR